MTTFKNNKKHFTTMKNFISILILMFLSLTIVNASSYISSANPNDVQYITGFFSTQPLASAKSQTSINNLSGFPVWITAKTDTSTLGLNYNQESTIGLLLRNENGTTSSQEINIYSNEVLQDSFNVSLPLGYNQWILITPDQNDEQIKVSMTCVSGCTGYTTAYYKLYTVKGEDNVNTIVTNIGNAVMSLIDINLAIWKLSFYVIIFALGGFCLVIIFFIGFKIYNVTKFEKEDKYRNKGE